MLEIKLDSSVEHQTIEGFGAFGGMVEMWEREKPYHNPTFLYRVLNELGLTITRNEIYPPPCGELQDSNWNKQKPFLQAYQEAAQEYKTPLKFIASIWSPPAYMKSNGSTKKGGSLLPNKYEEFGYYLLDAVDKYHEAGIPLYALSIQNEPVFSQEFNSCIYTAEEYRDTINVVGPILKSKYPDLHLFGQEHMLRHVNEYCDTSFLDKEASKYLDRFAVHGYANGEDPIYLGEAQGFWNRARTYSQRYGDVPVWMTETSNLGESYKGCFNTAMSIIMALKYGYISAWVYWLLSEIPKTPFSLMRLGRPKGNYYASKHFYKYIRPGAKMVECTYNDDYLEVCAFKHEEDKTLTVVIVSYNEEKDVLFDIEQETDVEGYRTSGAENCEYLGTFKSYDSFYVFPQTIHTFYFRY